MQERPHILAHTYRPSPLTGATLRDKLRAHPIIRTWGGMAQPLLTCLLPPEANGTEESVHCALLLCDLGSQGSSSHEEVATVPLPVIGCEEVSWSYSASLIGRKEFTPSNISFINGKLIIKQ